MCGIAGFYSPRHNFSEQELRSMATRMSHRGPDADGFFFDQTVGLAHRRLSIIDLSEHANQPMMYGSCTLVYNGEVYNYDEIRREQGIEVKTTSDTEIVLRLFEKYGTKAFEQFNGMFAIAVFDSTSKVLTLARDRVGIKPLYYYWDGSDFAFASELKSLLEIEKIRAEKQINPEAINQFLHLGFIPVPNSIYKHIYKLPTGSYLQFDGTAISIQPYWSVNDCLTIDTISNEMQAKEILRDLVEDSVRYRLKSDVPFGTFLSGGIDSSLVTAVAQRNHNQQIKTFSIGFDDAKHDESGYARSVAEYLGTEHHEFRVTEKDTLALVPSLLGVYDEPYADSSAFPTMLVSKLARQEVTMTLSGDGGDELFMGYGAHTWANRLAGGFLGNNRQLIGTVASLMSNRYKRVGNLLRYSKHSDARSHIFSQEQYLFAYDEVQKLRNSSEGLSFDKTIPESIRSFTPAEKQAYFDFNYYLPDDLLVKVDRASMHYGLESRVPLLDHTIVEFAMNLSPDLKMKGGIQKYLLKEVLYDYVPSNLFDRPKWGFSIPLMRWLKGDLAYLIDEYLSDEIVATHAAVNAHEVAQLKKKFRSGHYDYLYNRLWLLIVLHKFLEEQM